MKLHYLLINIGEFVCRFMSPIPTFKGRNTNFYAIAMYIRKITNYVSLKQTTNVIYKQNRIIITVSTVFG